MRFTRTQINDERLRPRWANQVKSWARFIAGGVALFAASLAWAEDSAGAFEYESRAAMLYKFLSYIEWPSSTFASEDSPYVIAVVGAESVAEELRDTTRHRTVNSRPVEVRQMKEPSALRDIHMLFIGSEENHRLNDMLKAARHRPIVTVTESESGLQEGGTINLRLVDGRVTFDVSLASAHKEQLRFSARMLAVASSVVKRGR